MNQNVPIIGGGIPNRPPLPDDLMQYTCPDHLAKPLAELTGKLLADATKSAPDSYGYVADRGTVGLSALPDPRKFYAAANEARKILGVRQWPNFETWAQANGIAEVVAQ